MNSELKLIRSLLQTIKDTSQWKTLGDKRMVQYIMKESRVHKETCEIYCKAREELKTLADNYLLYLTSRQKYEDIQRQFGGKGERSVEEVANLVGFKLPNNPK